MVGLCLCAGIRSDNYKSIAMFKALRRWLSSEETTTGRNIVRLEDIPIWTDLYGENKKDFAGTLRFVYILVILDQPKSWKKFW